MIYIDVIYLFELELFSINSKSECFDKRLFGNNCLNVYFPRFASTTPYCTSPLFSKFIIWIYSLNL